MTTDFERARSLYWGRQVLDEVRRHPSLPRTLVQRARELYELYPPDAYIESVAAGECARFSASEVQAIDGTGVLLQALCKRQIDFDLVGMAERTLRHYPLYSEENAGFVYWPSGQMKWLE